MPNAIESFAGLQELALHALICMLVLAVFASAIVEIFKSALRTTFYERIFKAWWVDLIDKTIQELTLWQKEQRSDKPSQTHRETWAKLGLDGPDLRYLDRPDQRFDIPDRSRKTSFYTATLSACTLPRDLFMKQVENQARTVFEQPSEHRSDFMTLACGVSPDDQQLVIATDRIGRTQPDRLNSLKSSKGDVQSLDPSIIAAQNLTSAMLERNLDDLQLRLMRLWPNTVRGFLIFAGIALTFAGAWWAVGFTVDPRFWALVVLVGIGAGVFAHVIHDLSTMFARINRT